jgi:pimeloyl-ACP methyl ester carboxylesterase/DNA-binding SARP family transcriptional activator
MEGVAFGLSLIGEIAVTQGGQQRALPASKKTRALLVFLAATGKEQRRERLCQLFWDVPDDPRGALRWSLSKLRNAVDGDGVRRLLADRESVRLALDDARCDLTELVQLADTNDVPSLEKAARRSGEFAPGLDLRGCEEFESWLFAMREDVRQLQLRVRRKLVEALADEPARMLPYIRQIVAIEPLDEGAWEVLVATLERAGRHEEADSQRSVASRTLEAAGIPVPRSLSSAPSAASRAAALPRQRIEFCTAPDGTSIAYSCVGSGPPLVKTANWLNHLEFEWESPIWRHWIEELSRGHRLLRYDERGNGLSDWEVKSLSFEAFVQDLETVIDAAGLDDFDLLGISQGCAVAIAYAVRHPGRVRSLILYGGYAVGWAKRKDPVETARREAMLTLTGVGWGQNNPAFRQMFTTLYFPDATEEEAQWFNELQRLSASPEGAQRLQRVLGDIDVRHLLAQVRTPTLVMHCRDDAVIPFEAGRGLARLIQGARFVALDSRNHLVLRSEPAWHRLAEEMRDFLSHPQ